MSQIDLGLPSFVTDNWAEHGFTEAVRRVTIQQRGADSTAAFNYYSSLLATLNAIGSETLPAVDPLGGTPSKRYCYAQVTPFAVRAAGRISDSMSDRSAILRLRASAAMTP